MRLRGGRKAGLLVAFLAVGILSLAARLDGWPHLRWRAPTAADVRAAHQPSDARLLSREGHVLHEIRTDPKRRALAWVPLAATSPALIEAVVRAEDRRFFAHGGVDLLAAAAALRDRLGSGARRGASTITMQLVALLDDDLRPRRGRRSAAEKLRQMMAALRLEATWSKTEILEAYLNLVPFRGEVEGVGAAAGALLGKSAHGIDAAEAALLAALLPAPAAPRERVLERARRQAPALAPAQLADAADRIFARPDRRPPTPRAAPHLARRLLRDHPGARSIPSTLDAGLQRFVTRALEEEVATIRARNVRDGAAVVLHNATGEVLAYVGSSGPLATTPHVDGVRAGRQAGSTLKPFLYALAIDRRMLTATSLLNDGPLEVPLGGAVYRPRNYDANYRGTVTLRTALAASLNVPAVRTQRLVGEPAFVDRLLALGFESLETSGDHYGPSLALGTASVRLLELANAYRTLARGGLYSEVQWTRGKRRTGPPRRVYSPEASFVVSRILSDRDARSTTFGLENALATRFWSAVKTGTSKEMRDNWCVGFSDTYTVGVWVGNSSGEPMHDVSGITGAAPTWQRILSHLHRERTSRPPPPPAGVIGRTIALPDGTTRQEWFLAGTEPPANRIVRAQPPPEITAPVEGSILAMDPDIPPGQQRLALVATPARASLRWRLGGDDLGPASAPVLWEPRAGRHRLQLLDASGAVVDEVRFRVHGIAPEPS